MEPESYRRLKQEIIERMVADRPLLDQLRREIRPLRGQVRPIQSRTTTAISLVATDGGNNSLRFDPFLVQIVRVVDSSNNEYCLEAITPTTKINDLSAKQFNADGSPRTALGEMMQYLGVSSLEELSYIIHEQTADRPAHLGWVKAYRELVEWAILFSIIRKKDFGTDTLVIYDGLLRSTIFSGDLFKKYLQGIEENIDLQRRKYHRKIYLAGVAKGSKVLLRYHLAMVLEGILTTNFPAYAPIPREIEEKTYAWVEYARGEVIPERDFNEFVGGKMHFVKFGRSPRDPIWPIDIYLPQLTEAPHILGCMLTDALNGFPVPLYPRCLQKAHDNAAMVDFDFDILQDHIFDGIRTLLAHEAPTLDAFRLRETNPAQRRYD